MQELASGAQALVAQAAALQEVVRQFALDPEELETPVVPRRRAPDWAGAVPAAPTRAQRSA